VEPPRQPLDVEGVHAVTLRCAAGRLPVEEAGRATMVPPLTLIPYHLWANRGPAAMRVWLPER
jgi:hypothetical protein